MPVPTHRAWEACHENCSGCNNLRAECSPCAPTLVTTSVRQGLAPALLGNAVAWGGFFYCYEKIKVRRRRQRSSRRFKTLGSGVYNEEPPLLYCTLQLNEPDPGFTSSFSRYRRRSGLHGPTYLGASVEVSAVFSSSGALPNEYLFCSRHRSDGRHGFAFGTTELIRMIISVLRSLSLSGLLWRMTLVGCLSPDLMNRGRKARVYSSQARWFNRARFSSFFFVTMRAKVLLIARVCSQADRHTCLLHTDHANQRLPFPLFCRRLDRDLWGRGWTGPSWAPCTTSELDTWRER